MYFHLPGRDIQEDKQALLNILEKPKAVKDCIVNMPGVDYFRLMGDMIDPGTRCMQRNSFVRECRAAETPHKMMEIQLENLHHDNGHLLPQKIFEWMKCRIPPRYLPQIAYTLGMSWCPFLNCYDCRLAYPELHQHGCLVIYQLAQSCSRVDKKMVYAMLEREEEDASSERCSNDKFEREMEKITDKFDEIMKAARPGAYMACDKYEC